MRHAFTLIELLVVIAIIAVLASMLMPAIGLVRQQAQETQCRGNLRQLCMAAVGYTSDSNGIVPGYRWNTAFHWTASLAEYLDTSWAWNAPQADAKVRIYRCPSDGGSASPYINGSAASNGYYVTYGIWQMASVPKADGWSHWGRYDLLPLGRIQGASDFLLFADANSAAWGESINTDWWTMTSFRHRKQVECAFLDGHVAGYDVAGYGRVWDAAWSTLTYSF